MVDLPSVLQNVPEHGRQLFTAENDKVRLMIGVYLIEGYLANDAWVDNRRGGGWISCAGRRWRPYPDETVPSEVVRGEFEKLIRRMRDGDKEMSKHDRGFMWLDWERFKSLVRSMMLKPSFQELRK